MKPKYDWQKIEKEYVEGVCNESGSVTYPSFRDLNAKYSASFGVLSR